MSGHQPDLFFKPSGRTAIVTASGFVFDLTNPNAAGLPVEDIARALAYQPRWCGATRHFYSVAEHCVMVSRLVPPPLAYSALFHDAIEFIQGDWPSPLKAYLGRDEINQKLAPIEDALAQRFGFKLHDGEIKKADLVAMATELRDLLPPAWIDWGHLPPPSPERIDPVGPEKAFALFMQRFDETKHLARKAAPVEPSFFESTADRLAAELYALFEDWVDQRSNSNSTVRTERALGKKSAGVYREMWQAFAKYCASRTLDLPDLLAEDLETFLLSRATINFDQHNISTTEVDLSIRYARRFLTLIDRLIRFQAEGKGISANAAAQTILLRDEYRYANAAENTPLPEYLSDVQANHLITFLTQVPGEDGLPLPWKTVRDRTAVAMMLGGGLSPGDVRALLMDGVIRKAGYQHDIPYKLSLPGNGNSGQRETPLAEWAAHQLTFWLKIRDEQKISGSQVFPSTRAGRVWSHTRCFEACRKVLNEAGMREEAGSPFKLRHSFALRQLSSGKSEADVARWLGLVDPNLMKRYLHIIQGNVDAV